MTCKLCEALENEPKRWENQRLAILNTKAKKGHIERIMVMTKEHARVVPAWLEQYMVDVLEDVGREIFAYAPKFVIMAPLLATVEEHAHFVASDLRGDDFEQVLQTPWIKVVDNL